MKERAANNPAPAADIIERLPMCVGELKKPFIAASRNCRRVVEFMPAYGAAGSAERTVSEKPCFPIAKMQLARREAGRMSQQADHGMTRPLSILKAFAEHHVATAFTVHRARRCKSPQTRLEMKG